MKKLIITALVCVSSVATKAQAPKVDTVKILTTVSAGSEKKDLTKDDIDYILSRTRNRSVVAHFSMHSRVIKNNDAADVILAVLKARK